MSTEKKPWPIPEPWQWPAELTAYVKRIYERSRP